MDIVCAAFQIVFSISACPGTLPDFQDPGAVDTDNSLFASLMEFFL